ncbi:MAG: ABC transporter permease [Spirochaetes bacterium]|nr:ABC transporter permease [Spirochaetota bacterium]
MTIKGNTKKLLKLNIFGEDHILQKFIAVSGLLVLLVYFSVSTNNFFTPRNFLTIGLQTTTIAFMGIGVTFAIITGGIDLSIGSVVALTGVTAGLLVKAGAPVWLAFIAALLAGLACGIINGLLITKIKLPPFIATLGMMMVARGIALQITDAKPVSGLPDAFGRLGNGTLFEIRNSAGDLQFVGIPYPVIIMIATALLFSFILTKTKIGRYTYSIGSNEEASRLSGINVNFVKIISYSICGSMSGLAGIIIMSRLVTAQPNAGVAYELDAIASAVIGGTSLMGGIGTISGTMIGAFIIGILRNGLNMQGVSSFVQQIIIGIVIIVAVGFDQLRNRKV